MDMSSEYTMHFARPQVLTAGADDDWRLLSYDAMSIGKKVTDVSGNLPHTLPGLVQFNSTR
jgi:hypothetical protein